MRKIKLLHYSNSDFKGYIKPSFFGQNDYTRTSVKESGINRSYFYIGRGKEYFLQNTKFCYIAEIEQSKLYDIDKDVKDLENECLDFTEILQRVKNYGYRGIKGSNGFNCVCLFYPIKYIDKKVIK